MKQTILFFWLTMALMHNTCAQQRVYDHLLTIQSDNDNYKTHSNDGYYTNGIFIRYSYIPHHFKKPVPVSKVTSWYSLAQQIYTSGSIFDEFPPSIDRPFSAYLFIQKGYQFFYRNGRALKLSFSAGLTGKGAKGKEVQDVYHDPLKLVHTRGWNYQLKTGLALSAEAEGFSPVSKQRSANPAIHYTYQFRFGSVYDDLTAGILMRLGKKQILQQSAFTEGNTGPATPARELFFYLWPRLRYQIYNATVQGGLLNKDKGPITAHVQQGQWIAEAGVCVAGKQQSLRFSFIGQAREARSMRNNMGYGSIVYSHFLHIKRHVAPERSEN